jgi:hypothetical protein
MVKPSRSGGLQPRVRHVVGVADPGHGAAGNRAALLDEGEDVGQDLARVVLVGQSVDDRHPRMGGKALDLGVLVGADHHDVDHPRDHAGGVFDRLAATQLRVAGGDVNDRSAELVHARFEADARARTGLFKHHRERAVAQRLVELVALEAILDDRGAREHVFDLIAREIGKLQEVTYRGSHGGP